MAKVNLLLRQINDVTNKVYKKTSKPKLIIFLDIIFCLFWYRASPNNYFYFGFYDLDLKHRYTYTTHQISEKIQKKYNNKDYIDVFYDKYEFSKVFKDYYGRKCIKTDGITIEKYCEFVKGQNKIIFKPLLGGQGKGIEIIDIENPVQSYKKIETLHSGVLETWINQHDDLNSLYCESINPIRVTTVFDGNKCHLLAATLTIGRNTRFANASQNSLFALVNVNNGLVYTDACDYDLNLYKEHPQTKVKFKGFQIPYWDEVIDMLSKASSLVPQVGYIGWDVAITDNGPIIIEGNNDPGYVGYQLAVLCPDGIGTKSIYSKYL